MGEAGRRPTIRDVSALAGVSHQTVSRYLRDDSSVRLERRQRIAQAIAQLDYRPSLVAQAMRGRKTGRLAFLLLAEGNAVSSLRMFNGAADEAALAGYVLDLVALGGTSPERAGRTLEMAESGLFEGIVSVTALPPEVISRSAGIPIAIQEYCDSTMHTTGELAEASAIRELIVGLVAQGHRHFFHIGGDYQELAARTRRDTYLHTIAELGLSSHGVVECHWRGDEARAAVEALTDDTPVTAVVTGSDVLAAGAISGALARGWQVPGRLSVTGWDNRWIGDVMTPSLTTVSVDFEEFGRRAMRSLLTRLNPVSIPQEHDRLTTVVWRESTGPAPSLS
ncbi:MAG: LacI family DNA-binding transcriptional regulator [Propioniciclava sp.]